MEGSAPSYHQLDSEFETSLGYVTPSQKNQNLSKWEAISCLSILSATADGSMGSYNTRSPQ